MKKIFTLLFVIGIFPLIVSSQTLSPTVVSSSGGFVSNSAGMLSYTVAEMTMVQTFIQSANILTQGFQQPEDMSVGIKESIVDAGGTLIYPNPTNGSFTLSYYNYDNSQTEINLYNMLGQILLTKTVSQTVGLNTQKFDISTYSQGMYFLEFTSTNSKGEKKTAIHKISLEY
ncbi:MAG: T9SS type A sorting domain-containing protein [Bacteroidales bacterium]|jgi:hypothetical protein